MALLRPGSLVINLPELREACRRLRSVARITDQHLFDRSEITLVVDEIDDAVDAKDRERCRGYFTDEIYADFTSLAGGSPDNIPSKDLVGA